MHKFFYLFPTIALLNIFQVFSNSIDTIIPQKIDEEIVLDGNLTENVWQNIDKINNFTQREPLNGEPATEKTEVAFCYDTENLYIGVWCYDQNPSKIIRKGMKRDFENWRDDTFSLILDPNNDKTSGYVFIINSNGARRDGTISKFGNINFSWNGIWDVASSVNEYGWFAEIQIPFSTLSFTNKPVQEWGINFKRDIRHKVEEVLWQGWNLNSSFTNLQNAGKIRFEHPISSNQVLDLKPYVLVGMENSSNTTKIPGKIGADANLSIYQNVKLNLTFNTDFAQVESDELKVNLSRFSLFFPEKRDFFLESNNVFDFSLSDDGSMLFYSRRIGISNGQLVPILAGAKLTGRMNNTTFGVISIQTDKFNTEPTANSSIVRLEQSIGNQYKIGGIFTSKVNSNNSNLVYGIDFNYNTNRFLENKNLTIVGRFAQTYNSNNPLNLNNAYSIGIFYPNNIVETSLSFVRIQPNFDAQLGFINRKNIKQLKYELEFRPRINGGLVRNFYFRPIFVEAFWTDTTNELESMNLSITPLGIFTKFGDFVKFQFNRKYDRLDQGFQIKDGFDFKPGNYWFNTYSVEFDTYGGRQFTSWFMFQLGDFYDANYINFYSFVAYNFNEHLNINASYSINKLTKGSVELLDNKITSRVDYSLNPKLSSSLFAQYSNFYNEILINFRLNWIPKIGSDFYFVINQTISRQNPKWIIENTTVLTKFVWHIPVI